MTYYTAFYPTKYKHQNLLISHDFFVSKIRPASVLFFSFIVIEFLHFFLQFLSIPSTLDIVSLKTLWINHLKCNNIKNQFIHLIFFFFEFIHVTYRSSKGWISNEFFLIFYCSNYAYMHICIYTYKHIKIFSYTWIDMNLLFI